ncbi:hypothetical protein [Actinopolymorpha rutila]|uniref:Uncharacterized protein n=1 Tax=Actinopolymorpha rutila TaxID=446787 RepID=A0A852ZM44_9ACTN|nr:hypothetical protein [Actinopolymorpha rutila]NYH92948.1 hypothetical protein [Actinopolymorpha rutila]
MGWFWEMNPAVQAAVLSGVVALGVSVIGLFGAIVAQGRAARKAHAQALDLFRQESRRQRDLAMLAERRQLYGRFLRMARIVPEAKAAAAEAMERQRLADAGSPPPIYQVPPREDDGWQAKIDELLAEHERAREQLVKLVEWEQVQEEIRLLAPYPVLLAARRMVKAFDGDDEDQSRAETDFLMAARQDLGTDVGAGS